MLLIFCKFVKKQVMDFNVYELEDVYISEGAFILGIVDDPFEFTNDTKNCYILRYTLTI